VITDVHNAPRRESGFSLIEVLVSTVVFSIGVLGVAGLGAVSKRATFESVQRGQASELAYALLEEMRANKAGIAVYLAAGTLGHGSLGAEPAPDCDVVVCTAAQFAAHSLWAWERMLDTGLESSGGASTGGLVEPSACIAGPAGGAAGDYVVAVVWRGVTELTDAGLTACGAGSGLYGAGDNMRRMVVVQSFIDPAI
jgi:type IV pilus assembly protein PilV